MSDKCSHLVQMVPGEDWLYCYEDDVTFEIEEMMDSPSHPPGWSPGPPREASR
jgi:hypothetical protein